MTALDNEVPPLRRTGERAELTLGRSPVPMIWLDLELAEPLPSIGADSLGAISPDDERAAFVLLRLHRRPLTTLLLRIPADGLSATQLADVIWRRAGDVIAEHARSDGLTVPDRLEAGGFWSGQTPRCQEERLAVLARAPEISVVVATRERPRQLRRCLDSLARLNYPRFEVVVVDNDPVTDATATLIRSQSWDVPVHYAREDRRGLAAAHNRGIEVGRGDVVAFTDDDVEVDPDWLAAVAEGFAHHDDVAAVTGLILPAELRTRAQVLLEQHGRFAKGFSPCAFDLWEHRPADPLFPFTAGQLGSGANMAFDAGALRAMGGFDPAMGTGTSSMGGDDLVALFSIIASGRRLVYTPQAVVFHYHRDDLQALGRQSFGYGVGLGAYLTNVAVHHPGMALNLLRHGTATWWSTRRLFADRQARYESWPPELERMERSGLLRGPGSYARSRWQNRGAARPGGTL